MIPRNVAPPLAHLMAFSIVWSVWQIEHMQKIWCIKFQPYPGPRHNTEILGCPRVRWDEKRYLAP